jgi:hypothetical protein
MSKAVTSEVRTLAVMFCGCSDYHKTELWIERLANWKNYLDVSIQSTVRNKNCTRAKGKTRRSIDAFQRSKASTTQGNDRKRDNEQNDE